MSLSHMELLRDAGRNLSLAAVAVMLLSVHSGARAAAFHRYLGPEAFEVTEDRGDGEHATTQCSTLILERGYVR
jgi:hypothetical protein